ncbi:MAG: class I SAM-dependent methyltransferase [Rhodospirillales bacterium]|nr:class I SAM-dependent methyltransferase [Acetobacter sp.]
MPAKDNSDKADFWDDSWKTSLEAPIHGPDDASYWPNEIDERKLRFIRRSLPQAGTVAEVGCGSARFLARIGRTSPKLHLVAIDESPNALKLAQRTAEAFDVTIEARESKVEHLPFETASVDLILSGGLMEHFQDPVPILKEMLRVLRVGGVFYADVVPRKLSWYRSAEASRMKSSEWLAPDVYEAAFGESDYRRWLTELGCEHLAICYAGVYPPHMSTLRPAIRKPLGRLLEFLDGTPLAERWGWYFMVKGQKVR